MDGSLDELIARFDAARADFLRGVFASRHDGARSGRPSTRTRARRPWERARRIVAALEYLDQQGLVELRAADARQRYTLLQRRPRADELVDQARRPLTRREQAETSRVGQVLALVEHDGCQVRELAAYFGEERTERAATAPTAWAARNSCRRACAAARIDTVVDRAAVEAVSRVASRRARRAAPARALPMWDHEPRDNAREADPGAALRKPLRLRLPRRARLGHAVASAETPLARA